MAEVVDASTAAAKALSSSSNGQLCGSNGQLFSSRFFSSSAQRSSSSAQRSSCEPKVTASSDARARSRAPAALDGKDVYEAERLLAKRWSRGARRPQYLVRWVGYGPEDALRAKQAEEKRRMEG